MCKAKAWVLALTAGLLLLLIPAQARADVTRLLILNDEQTSETSAAATDVLRRFALYSSWTCTFASSEDIPDTDGYTAVIICTDPNRALNASVALAIQKSKLPVFVIGAGGYVSGPIVRAAARRGIKTAIHEQNAFPGVTNKLLAKEVNIVLAASADAVEKLGAPEKTTVVGNPVRPEVLTADRAAARAKLNAGNRTVILSFGGSLGADRINQVVADLCAWEKQTHRNVLHLHATGSRGVKLFEELEKEKDFAPGENLVVTEYINNMPQLLAAADLVIARSGALTLAELEAVGRASVLIPSPNVAENHQYYNALELQKAGAAVVIEEKNLTGDGLVKTVETLLTSPGKLAEMGANAKTLGNPHSLDLITEKLLKLVNG